MIVYAIIPARSGSIGLKDKNIKLLAGKPLISYSIDFAKKLNVDRVFCSTDSSYYGEIAEKLGAEVPFLRSEGAATGTAMEQDILADLYSKFKMHSIVQPDIIVWLRPTFVFRDLEAVKSCIELLCSDQQLTSARTVCETECRLYSINQLGKLVPDFKDNNRSMIRRQDVGKRYKVFSTDVFRSNTGETGDDFLGRNIAPVIINKICGLDIDDEFDFQLVEALIVNDNEFIRKYLH